MTQALYKAVERLVTVLEAENAALAALEFDRVGSFVGEKRGSLEALSSLPPDAIAILTEPAHKALALRLHRSTTENKRLLEQAIIVQNRIMAVLAGAARQAQALPGYGARGHRPRSTCASAVALVVRA